MSRCSPSPIRAGRLGGRTAFAVLAALLAGCSGDPEKTERWKEQMMLGEHYYMNRKFEDAVGRYTDAIEFCQDDNEIYKATLGAATSASEYSMSLYEQAENLFTARNSTMAKKTLDRADQMASVAHKGFHKLLQLRPHDTIANYYLGLFFYKRATAVGQLPYPATEKGAAQRKKERDEALANFRIVLTKEGSDDITKPEHGPKCSGPHAHRYMSLSLLTRMDWDRNDGEAARAHMTCYLNYILWLREKVKRDWPQTDENEKRLKEKELDRLWQELGQTQGLFKDTVKSIAENLKRWESNEDPEFAKLEPAVRERWINAATRELVALQAVLREFENQGRKMREGDRSGGTSEPGDSPGTPTGR